MNVRNDVYNCFLLDEDRIYYCRVIWVLFFWLFLFLFCGCVFLDGIIFFFFEIFGVCLVF